jgi:F-type H+-transporting ATPase subunit alpha
MTALPIIETEAQNIAAYIPTNLISITDGQIYLSPDLFAKGQLPAIDIGKSVSRVGGKAQLPALRVVAGDLKLRYAQFEELEIFARFGTRLDEETRRKLVRGERVRAALQQGEHAPMPVAEQAAVLLAATQGTFDDVAPGEVAEAEQRVRRVVRERHPTLCEAMEAGEALSAQDREMLLATVRDAVGGVAAHAGPEA